MECVQVGGFGVYSSGKRVVVCVTIDNLLKGAATQCLRKLSSLLDSTLTNLISVENMNLSLGFVEYEGIPLD
jgi:N-acetyl-gamma-glutamyl-phosphate reductase/acetylglutamate kinase